MLFLCACAAPLWHLEAADFALAPGQNVVGEFGEYVVKHGDVFADIARRFDLGYTELAVANPGVDPWVPGVGRRIKIPTRFVLPNAPHSGIVVNLAQSRLFYYPPGGGRVETHPLGIGIIGKNTPLGITRVVSKEPNPTWYPPPSIHAEEPDLPAAVPPGPDNPLGAFALHLGWKNYLIHGTNKPDGVGRNVSHGCIRLYPEDIESLFGAVSVGTPVRTVSQPVAAGWAADGLYVAVYPSKQQIDEIDTERPVTLEPAEGVEAAVAAAAGSYAATVDRTAVARAAQRRDGVPVRVAGPTDNIASAQPYPSDAGQPDPRQTRIYPRQPAPSDSYAPPPYPHPAAGDYRPDPAQPYGPNSVMGAYHEEPGQRYQSEAEESYRRSMRWFDRAEQLIQPDIGEPTDLRPR